MLGKGLSVIQHFAEVFFIYTYVYFIQNTSSTSITVANQSTSVDYYDN